VVALTVTPALAALLLGGGRREPSGRPSLASRAYQATLRGVMRAPRWLAAASCLATLSLAGVGAAAVLAVVHPGQPQFQDRNLVIRWTGTPGMSLPELDRLAARTSQQLTALPAVADVAATVGRAVSSDQIVSTNSAEIWVTIKPGAPYGRAVSQVRAIAGGMPGVAGTVGTYESDSMGGVLAAAPGALTVRLYGSDYAVLARLGRQVEAVMARISGLGPARMQLPASQPTLNVAVDLTAATRNGVKPGDIRREAATLLSGLTVGNFFEQQKVFDVVVQGTAAVRASPASVSDLLLDTVNGGHARLGALARVSVAAEPLDITHDATSPYLDVTARLSGRGLGSARAAVAAGLRGISFPLSYYAAVAGPPAGQAVFGWRLASYVIAALVGILLLAQAVTGSWRLALLVLASLPVPVAVGLLTAYRLGTQDSLAALAGLLGVLAVAIHQAFRVTAAIRRAHLADGGPLPPGLAAAAAAGAAGPAFTAALMSAAALVPFVVAGQVAGNELPHAAAPVILAGLGAATLLNTLVLPAACLWFGPARAAQDLPESLAPPPDGPPDVPQPRAEPEVPSAAARPENPVS
jgi:Cu/Ag efflux pump CusA